MGMQQEGPLVSNPLTLIHILLTGKYCEDGVFPIILDLLPQILHKLLIIIQICN